MIYGSTGNTGSANLIDFCIRFALLAIINMPAPISAFHSLCVNHLWCLLDVQLNAKAGTEADYETLKKPLILICK